MPYLIQGLPTWHCCNNENLQRESIHFLDASSYLYMKVCPSVGPSIRPAVTLFFNARKRVFSTIETARNFGWRREMLGSDEVGKEGCDEGGGDEGGGDNVGDASDGRLSGLVFFW